MAGLGPGGSIYRTKHKHPVGHERGQQDLREVRPVGTETAVDTGREQTAQGNGGSYVRVAGDQEPDLGDRSVFPVHLFVRTEAGSV